MTFDEWYEREGKHMESGGCGPETIARAAFVVAINEAKRRHEGRIGFIRGAKWWQAYMTGATAFPHEVDQMEAEAFREYPNYGGHIPDARKMVEGFYHRNGWTETRSGRHAVRIKDGLLLIAEAKYYRELLAMEAWQAGELADVMAAVAADMPANA